MIEVLKQMLEVLEYWDVHGGLHQPTEEAIEAGKQAIAELESQEPVSRLKTSNVLLRCYRCGFSDKLNMQIEYTHPLQPAKPIPCANHCEAAAFEIVIKNLQGEIERLKASQRTWVGLTDEDDIDWEEGGNLKDLVKAIETKLKEKNT